MEIQINSIDSISFLQFTVTTLRSSSVLLQYISTKRKTKETVAPTHSEAGMLVAEDTGKNYSVPFTSGITGVICPQVSLTLWQSLQELGVTYS